MNSPPAEELNGLLLKATTSHEIWLIMFGSRHHIASLAVYENLFRPDTKVLEVEDVDHIRRSFDICDGSLLIRAQSTGKIFLVTAGENGKINKYYVANYETFAEFSFEMNNVLNVPDIISDAINESHRINSIT